MKQMKYSIWIPFIIQAFTHANVTEFKEIPVHLPHKKSKDAEQRETKIHPFVRNEEISE